MLLFSIKVKFGSQKLIFKYGPGKKQTPKPLDKNSSKNNSRSCFTVCVCGKKRHLRKTNIMKRVFVFFPLAITAWLFLAAPVTGASDKETNGPAPRNEAVIIPNVTNKPVLVTN